MLIQNLLRRETLFSRAFVTTFVVLSGVLFLSGTCFAASSRRSKKNKVPRATISDPLVAVTPSAVDRLTLDTGFSRYGYETVLTPGESPVETEHVEIAFALNYEAASSSRLFGMNLRIPFGLADGDFMLGDVNMRFRWRVLNNQETDSYLSIGFEFNFPSTLINTLGGSRFDIEQKRLKNAAYRGTYSGKNNNGVNVLPMRYGNIGPQVAFAQKAGPVTLGAHLHGSLGIVNRFRNLYDSPGVEFRMSYDIYAVYNIFGTRLLEVIAELGGVSYLSSVAFEGTNVEAPAEPDEFGTGLNFTLALRTEVAKRFEAILGFQMGIPVGDRILSKEKRGFDLTAIYRHDWSLMLRVGVLF